jgi:hypothetical protein
MVSAFPFDEPGTPIPRVFEAVVMKGIEGMRVVAFWEVAGGEVRPPYPISIIGSLFWWVFRGQEGRLVRRVVSNNSLILLVVMRPCVA